MNKKQFSFWYNCISSKKVFFVLCAHGACNWASPLLRADQAQLLPHILKQVPVNIVVEIGSSGIQKKQRHIHNLVTSD